MKHRSWALGAASLLILSGRFAAAVDSPRTLQLGLLDSRTDIPRELAPVSPAVQVGEITGTISTYDHLFRTLSVTDPQGKVIGFSVQSNTPILDVNHLQLGFGDLHPGDRVTIHYNIEALWINQIDKI
jgi:hypothetical protein